jgi:hypothetical protein
VTVSAAQLKAEFPEFVGATDALVEAKIADAERMVHLSLGAWRDQAIKMLACHYLCISPHGEFARLVEDDPKQGQWTTYEREYKRILSHTIPAVMLI